MKLALGAAPYQRGKNKTEKIMLQLLVALTLVSIVAIAYQFSVDVTLGVRAILIILVSLLVTLATDIVTAIIVKEKFNNMVNYVFKNYSYITAIIFALTLPIDTHLYVVAVGAVFATAVGKIVFGGFGKNIFNPAIVGRIMIAVAFGATISNESITNQFLASGTVTAKFVTENGWLQSTIPNLSSNSLMTLLLGNYQGAIGETFTLLLLAIGIVLVILKVIDYRQPLFYLGTVAVASLLIALISKQNIDGMVINNPFDYMLLHLSLGGLMFGAVFMITDPVTTPVSNQGKIIASILAGVLTMLIRVKAGAVEGVMYSIAFVNLLTPFIDNFITGKTTIRVNKRIFSIASVAVVGLLFTTLSAYHPRPADDHKAVDAVEYIGSAEGFEIQGLKKVKVDAKLYLKADVFADLILDYSEIDVDSGTINKSGFYHSVIVSGDFYNNYLSKDVLKDKTSTQLKEHFDINVTAATPGVAGATKTAEIAVLAIKDALTKVPTAYVGEGVTFEDHGTKIIITVTLYVLEDVLVDYSYDYIEVLNDGEGPSRPGTYSFSIASGDFYDTYVKKDVLVGTTLGDLKQKFNLQVDQNTPGVAGATYTAKAFVLAFNNAILAAEGN